MRAHAAPEYLLSLLSRADVPHREKLAERIVRASGACGCKSGAVALVIAMAASVAWWVLQAEGRLVMWPQGAYAAGAALIAALVGKATGIAAARLWLWAVRWRLERLLRLRETAAAR